jgi:hypothetical protein
MSILDSPSKGLQDDAILRDGNAQIMNNAGDKFGGGRGKRRKKNTL